MRSALGNGAAGQDNDLVGVADGRGTVRNENRGTAFHDSAQSCKDALLGLCVHGGKRIVQDQNSWIADDGARNRGTLFLSAGESDAALADHGLVSLAEALDVTVQAGNFGCFADALLVIFRQAKGDVAADGLAEQVGVLRHEADGLAQRDERPLAYRTPVDQHRVIGRFPETCNESGERGLAATRGADDSERRACGDFQIYVAEHRMRTAAIGLRGPVRTGSGKSGRISKGEMTEFDFAARLGAFGDFRVAIIDIRFGGEDVLQTAHGSRAALKNICDPTEGNHRPDEQSEIAVEGDESAERNLAAEKLVAALP